MSSPARVRPEVTERDKYRADVATDLALHHKMLHELHRRLKVLEDAAAIPRIVLPSLAAL